MRNIFFLLLIGFCNYPVYAQLPMVRYEDKVRIKEAKNISDLYGDKIWEGYSKVPFTLLLVADSVEFLFYHTSPVDGFIFLEDDTLTKSKIFYRKRVFNKSFLATFPAVNGKSCIVVGLPENTQSKKSTQYIITLLHEHFHQYQQSYPDYFSSVENLNLSKGDKTGMWQLNYDFPYNDSTVINKYNTYASTLEETIKDIGTKKFHKSLKSFLLARKDLKVYLSEEDYNYFSFQLWQEGIARYTEYKLLELLEDYQPSKELKELPDFIPFKDFKEKFYKGELDKIMEMQLSKAKRECFYSIGLEGLILDVLNPNWREQYMVNKFHIEKYAKEHQYHKAKTIKR